MSHIHPINILSRDEMLLMIDPQIWTKALGRKEEWIAYRNAAAVALILCAGLTPRQITHLSGADWRPDGEDVVRVDAPSGKSGQHGRRRRKCVLPVLPIAALAVQHYLDRVPFAIGPSDPLFATGKKQRLHRTFLGAPIRTMARERGISWHYLAGILRTSFAVHLERANDDGDCVDFLLARGAFSGSVRRDQEIHPPRVDQLAKILIKHHPLGRLERTPWRRTRKALLTKRAKPNQPAAGSESPAHAAKGASRSTQKPDTTNGRRL